MFVDFLTCWHNYLDYNHQQLNIGLGSYEIGKFQEKPWNAWNWRRVPSRPPIGQIFNSCARKLQNLSFETFAGEAYLSQLSELVCNVLSKIVFCVNYFTNGTTNINIHSTK